MFVRPIRAFLYALLFACSVVLLGLTAYRINYTKSLDFGDILTPRRHFYDGVIVELLVTSCLAIIISLAFLSLIMARRDRGPMKHVTELVCLLVLWFMWLVGSAVTTDRWSSLRWCRGFNKQCRILETIKAFSWICWCLVTFLIIATLISMVRDKDRDGTAYGRQRNSSAALYPETRSTTTTTASHQQPVSTA